ncbi:estradiol 17-beta-dehydrogenase 2 isoform X1 [Pygocentrus nattereri]|uniref:Hydroxysteroid (17-beta) dehydrogenase 2 n=1 Tax=Pygocentrus nattereri TaxID=42514 RepID=A0A3B4BNY8_PYGNA|nr:estradiol 17-beta-dehydrogenase 2 isoform X1 [Pygocentrus nattereri]
MEEGASEVWLCPLCVLMIATSAAVLLLWGRGGRSAGLMVVGVLLCCVIPAGCFILALLSVGYTVIHCTAGRQELLLSAQGKSVLITGCDSGFGHNLAKLLDRAGVKVYAGVLKENGAGAQELRRVSSPQLTVLQLDITDTNQISKTLQFIKSQTGETGLWGLVNNAGVTGFVCDAEILPLRILRKILDVNFIAGVEMTLAFLPLIRQTKGRIVNVSSVGGEVPFPGFAAYGSSKAALTAYSGVLRQELSQWGVKVAIIQPGCFRTNILGNEEEWSKIEKEILSSLIQEVREAYGEEYICSLQRRLSALTTAGSTDTTPVLDAITHALFAERPRGFYRPGPSAVSLSLLHMFCPTWLFDLVFSKITRYNRVKPAGVVSK